MTQNNNKRTEVVRRKARLLELFDEQRYIVGGRTQQADGLEVAHGFERCVRAERRAANVSANVEMEKMFFLTPRDHGPHNRSRHKAW